MKDRLTKRIGKYVYYNDNGKEILATEIMNDEIHGVFKLKELLAKLANYEDTGYDPEEIKEISSKRLLQIPVKVDFLQTKNIKEMIGKIINQIKFDGYISEYNNELLKSLVGKNYKEKYKILEDREENNIYRKIEKVSNKLDESICYEIIVEGIKYQKIIDKLNSKLLELTEDEENEDKKSI